MTVTERRAERAALYAYEAADFALAAVAEAAYLDAVDALALVDAKASG